MRRLSRIAQGWGVQLMHGAQQEEARTWRGSSLEGGRAVLRTTCQKRRLSVLAHCHGHDVATLCATQQERAALLRRRLQTIAASRAGSGSSTVPGPVVVAEMDRGGL